MDLINFKWVECFFYRRIIAGDGLSTIIFRSIKTGEIIVVWQYVVEYGSLKHRFQGGRNSWST